LRRVLPLILLLALVPHSALAEAARRFVFEYESAIGPLPDSGETVHLFVPIPQDSEHQKVLSRAIDAGVEGTFEREAVHGNLVWHAETRAEGQTLTLEARFEVERSAHQAEPVPGPELTAAERAKLAPFLEPDARVVVGHPVLEPILAEIRPNYGGGSPAERARALYDWVVDNVEYKKIGSGWGNGDTFWACSERYGNCTDFHALFISLARTEGIPARFEMGFPVPDSRPSGEIGGYHCWVQFYVPGTGWVPIDASEAFKHPDKRELFFGTHPADRIRFTVGRDLQLGAAHQGAPLNYLIYPYVEVGGAPWKGPVERRFGYRDVAADGSLANRSNGAMPGS
jgi:transglutaminase-like putative cysteine protease